MFEIEEWRVARLAGARNIRTRQEVSPPCQLRELDDHSLQG